MYKLHLGRAVPTAAMAVFLGVSSLAPCAAFADDAVVYGAHGSGGGSSITANQQSVESTTQDKDGHYTEKASAVMTANIDTIGGHWTDSGDAQHDNGKYVVTIPTSVGFTGVDVGAVDLTADYGVTVAGVIENGDTVTATVDYSQTPNTSCAAMPWRSWAAGGLTPLALTAVRSPTRSRRARPSGAPPRFPR